MCSKCTVHSYLYRVLKVTVTSYCKLRSAAAGTSFKPSDWDTMPFLSHILIELTGIY